MLTTSTSDVLVGTTGNDTFEGVATTYDDTDRIIDTLTTDADTFNLTESGAVNPDVTNVENLNISLNSVSAVAVDASKVVGAKVLTITRGDVVISGTTVTGNKAAKVDNVDASQLAKIVAGTGVTSLDVNAAATDKAGLVVDATGVTGAVSVDGAATITANESTGTVAIDAVSNTTSTETVKAAMINAANAATVTTHADLTGSVTINAAKATTVTVNDAQGGATVNAGTTATGDVTITVVDVDASGATITTGTGSAISAEKEIDIILDGTAATTDAASIVAGGTIDLDIDGTNAGNVDVLTLSGNGAAVEYRLAAPTAGTFTSLTKAGTDKVTVSGDLSEFSATTISGIDVITVNAIAGGAAALDASKWTTVGNVNIGVDNANNKITANSDTKWTLTTATQTAGLDFDFATGSTNGNLTIVSGDVNGVSNTAVGTATVNNFNAAADATVVGTVTLEAFESNFTAASTVLGAKQKLVITGDEDVTLGAVTADDVNASASTGIINLTAGANVDTVTTGTGADVVVLNGAAKHTVSTGSGADQITVTLTNDESSVDAGEGDDTINADALGKVYVVAGGAGNDSVVATLAAGGDLDAYFVGGDGTDTLTFDFAGAHDFTDDSDSAGGADKFVFAGFEKLNITALNAALTLTAEQFANNKTLEITATGGDDTFAVKGGTTAATIDASGLTVASGSTVTIEYTGSTKGDTITGGKAAEVFKQSLGADTMSGGEGADTYQLNATGLKETGSTEAATGYVVNLGGSAITSAEVYAGISKYLGEGASNVAAGTVAYAYDSADSSTINNSAVVDSVSGIENVVGSNLADYIVTSDTASVVAGGAGSDYIKLGGSTDTVVFNSLTGSDTIVNYVLADDSIQLSKAVFTGLGVVGALTAAEFESGAGLVAAATAAGRIVHDTTTGDIYYDADGSGATAAVKIGTVGTAVDLVVGEFAIIA